MNRRDFIFSSVLLGGSSVLLSSCGYPAEINPPVFNFDTILMAKLSAEARARDIGGRVFRIADTKSMEPILKGDDFITVDSLTRRPFSSLKAGEIIVYRADWLSTMPVCHRLVEKDKNGWILRGDNVRPDIDPKTGMNRRSEASYRVDASDFIGVVDGIYRVKKTA